jgi:hypothetical protein
LVTFSLIKIVAEKFIKEFIKAVKLFIR